MSTRSTRMPRANTFDRKQNLLAASHPKTVKMRDSIRKSKQPLFGISSDPRFATVNSDASQQLFLRVISDLTEKNSDIEASASLLAKTASNDLNLAIVVLLNIIARMAGFDFDLHELNTPQQIALSIDSLGSCTSPNVLMLNDRMINRKFGEFLMICIQNLHAAEFFEPIHEFVLYGAALAGIHVRVVRQVAAFFVGNIGAALASAMAIQNGNSSVQAVAALTLCRDTLMKRANDVSSSIREIAAEALSELDDQTCNPKLLILLNDISASVRIAAIRALEPPSWGEKSLVSYIPRKGWREILDLAERDSEGRVRNEAVQLLIEAAASHTADETSLPEIQEALTLVNDADILVSSAACKLAAVVTAPAVGTTDIRYTRYRLDQRWQQILALARIGLLPGPSKSIASLVDITTHTVIELLVYDWNNLEILPEDTEWKASVAPSSSAVFNLMNILEGFIAYDLERTRRIDESRKAALLSRILDAIPTLLERFTGNDKLVVRVLELAKLLPPAALLYAGLEDKWAYMLQRTSVVFSEHHTDSIMAAAVEVFALALNSSSEGKRIVNRLISKLITLSINLKGCFESQEEISESVKFIGCVKMATALSYIIDPNELIELPIWNSSVPEVLNLLRLMALRGDSELMQRCVRRLLNIYTQANASLIEIYTVAKMRRIQLEPPTLIDWELDPNIPSNLLEAGRAAEVI